MYGCPAKPCRGGERRGSVGYISRFCGVLLRCPDGKRSRRKRRHVRKSEIGEQSDREISRMKDPARASRSFLRSSPFLGVRPHHPPQYNRRKCKQTACSSCCEPSKERRGPERSVRAGRDDSRARVSISPPRASRPAQEMRRSCNEPFKSSPSPYARHSGLQHARPRRRIGHRPAERSPPRARFSAGSPV